jgi:MoaA/NifB/PqqE/SkfB family radical SAM enzyme
MKLQKIQIEPNTFCNLSCQYCFRNMGLNPETEINLSIIDKITGSAREYVIYGFGEPLLNDNILTILERLDGEITISTNGMVDENFIEVVERVDKIGISVDIDSTMRTGMDWKKIEKKMRTVDGKGFAEVVVTKDNLLEMAKLLEIVASNGLDIFVSNMIAPTRELYDRTVYFESSRQTVELVNRIVEEFGTEFIINVIQDCSRGGGKNFQIYKQLLDEIYSEGYSVNLISISELADRIEIALKAERLFEELDDIVTAYGVRMHKPSFFGDAKGRECPYERSIFVRADGKTVSCMSFAYPHVEFVNSHLKRVEPFITGDLTYQEIDEIVKSLKNFECLRRDMSNFPWCADCPYVSGCWFAERNIDCYGNQPSCSECLYSCGIARCIM